MKVKNINICALAKVFVKYDFFNDDPEMTIERNIAYGILLDVYDALSAEAKDELYCYYNIIQSRSKKKVADMWGAFTDNIMKLCCRDQFVVDIKFSSYKRDKSIYMKTASAVK